MKFRHSLILLPALALTACSGGNENDAQTLIDPPGTTVNGSVVYSYPADGQSEVSARSDLVLRFSHAITDSDQALAEKILVMTGGEPVTFSITRIDEGRSLKLTPAQRLQPGADYTVTFDGELAAGTRSIATPNATGEPGIQFSTRGAMDGSLKARNLAEELTVARMIPAAGTAFLPVDFSTFRLQLTQPVHPQWQTMGGSIQLLDGNGEPVPATVLVRERAITVDPCIADSPSGCGMDSDLLNAGQTYTLQIENLPGQFGGTLDYTTSFTPEKSEPRVTLYQQIVDSGLNDGASVEQAERSLLNGQIINGITLESVLQGNAGPSQQTADLFAHVAYAPANDDAFGVPLRIPRNSKLASSSLDIRINGRVPVIDESTGTIQTTGDIKVTMLSDASGYLLPNPYSNSPSAPRHVRLWMDIAMNTEKAMPNAALSQDIMGLELTGIAQVRGGLLTIDAIGIVEPRLLGLENTEATIAFRIEADTSADVQFELPENGQADAAGPRLVSWMPGPADDAIGNRQAMQRPGDPVILNFDEPLERTSVREGITLTAGGTTYRHGDGNLNINVDGTSVVLNPAGGIEHGVAYTVGIASSVTDLVGNGATEQQLNFTLPATRENESGLLMPASPFVLTSYPGFPCTTEELDLTATPPSHGFCIDLLSRKATLTDLEQQARDAQPREKLPVTELPSDRPITIVFSQSMNPDSLNTQTFLVEAVSADSATSVVPGDGTPVEGELIKAKQQVQFVPSEPWEPGQLYRYTLISEQGATEVTEATTADGQPGICSIDGSDPGFICGENGLALQTDLLLNTADIGGENLTVYFLGAEPRTSVLNPLRNLPVRDTNSNFTVDCYVYSEAEDEYSQSLGATDCLEPFTHDLIQGEPSDYQPTANAAKLISPDGVSYSNGEEYRTRVGCPTAETSPLRERIDLPDCPESKFIYQTMGLNTEVIGPATDPETQKPGVEVMLYPSLLVTSSIDVYVELTPGGTFVLEAESSTGPQVLRMRYAKDDPQCETDCARNKPIPGIIIENDNGEPVFKTEAELLLDAPRLSAISSANGDPIGLEHNLFSYPFTLDLKGSVEFFDDGRMNITQLNDQAPGEITVDALALGAVELEIPLVIPVDGLYLNFLSNPMKSAPSNE